MRPRDILYGLMASAVLAGCGLALVRLLGLRLQGARLDPAETRRDDGMHTLSRHVAGVEWPDCPCAPLGEWSEFRNEAFR